MWLRVQIAVQLLQVVTGFSLHSDVPPWLQSRASHQPTLYTSAQVQKLCNLNSAPRIRKFLQPIMVSRPVGSENHRRVRQFIQRTMEHMGYSVEISEFSMNTVAGRKTFSNIVATLNPQAKRRFVLACHYDSKEFRPKFDFVGATDSAVPCALMLDVASSLQDYMNKMKDSDPTLQLIFFDGEEAFHEWTDADSLYGSRHLASDWEKRLYPAYHPQAVRELDRIVRRNDVLVLLDLMGSKNPKFYAHYPYTQLNVYSLLPYIEQQAKASKGCLKDAENMFQPGGLETFVADDHVPFMEKGVPVVHLIPLPFPDVWHTERDDETAVDYATVENLAAILRIFTSSYLNVTP